MSFPKVCHYLSTLPTSDYYGIPRGQIPGHISKNDAFIYLNDLIVINDRVKSNLYYISQVSGESYISEDSL